ncbi:MAG: hypothetical protein HYW38_01980 [Candidatus Colwellbacteria bacterium]|nr:hypothetical protein [Candidatus Colwellbacteria bacterium]
MTPLLVSSILIIGFTFLTFIFNKITRWRICVVCAGVSLTWLFLTALILLEILDSSFYILATAMLMGGTVVGIAFQGEKRFKWAASLFYWKAPVVVAGFISAYLLLINLSWTVFVIELILLGFLAYLLFLQPSSGESSPGKNASELEDKMKDCC